MARRQFNQFRDPETAGWAFFENAGGAYAPDMVVDKLLTFYQRMKLQPYYPYEPSEAAGAAMDRSQRVWSELINAEPEEVHLGPSTTNNVYVLANALAEELAPGDEVIVTDVDHEANIGAWRRLSDRGMRILEWQGDRETGVLHLADLEALLTARTRLVCATHCSNVIGVVTPVAEVVRLAHEVGARVVLDGVSHAPHAAIDVRALDVDFYLFSLYKVFGPHLGLLYTRRDHLERIANQGHYFNEAQSSKRLVPAGPNHGENIAAAGVADYFDVLYGSLRESPNGETRHQRASRLFDLIHTYEEDLVKPIRDYVETRSSFRLVGPPATYSAARAPIVAFTSARTDNVTIARRLAQDQIGCGHGHYYAVRLFERLGMDAEEGAVRISLAHYNTQEEVQRLLGALDDVA